jgi:hypothetical protein
MKKVKKNLIYLNLDDLQKLYGLDGKLLKKLKKKRKKRKKGQKGIKFDKIKDSQMPGVQYLNNNASNSDTQYLKDQIKKLEDKQEKQNKLLITDIQPNLVNNKLLMGLKQDNEKVKQGVVKMYAEASDTFNYIYDQFEELKKKGNNNAGYTVNYNDNIGDFSNLPNWSNPKETDEKKRTDNSLNKKSESIETPDYFPDVDLNELFYGDNTSDVMEPITEDKPVNDDQQPEDITNDTIDETQEEKEIINDIVVNEPPSFIKEEKEIISDPVVEDKPKIKKKKKPFKPPPRIAGEHGNAYNPRVEHFRKVYDGEYVTEWAHKRYGTKPNK